MAQLSRPFQIALFALVLFVGVWLAALHGHSNSTTSSSPAARTPAPATSAKSTASSNGANPGGVYHGSAPGVQGLTRALAKANGAVATSQQNAKQLEQKSAQASSPTTPAGASTSPAAQPASPAKSAAPATGAASKTHHTTSSGVGTAHHTSKPSTSPAQTGPQRKPAMQALVERALHEGKVAVILFWNSKGADDVATRNELRLLEAVHHLIRPVAGVPKVRSMLQRSGMELQKKFAAFVVGAKQVASFGSITRGVQVSQTPTLLVINKHGKVITLTGLTDAYSLEQAIDEARHS